MDFSSIYGTLFGGGDAGNIAQGLAGLYGNVQSMGTNNQVNQQIQPQLAQNQAATQAQIDALTGQINTNRQQAQDMYQRSLADVTSQNQGLESNIGTMTTNLNALSDPNSPYMQQARQAIERKDAAAGRRSQWGEREVQLAGTLADYTGKYAPGINQSITSARDQISRNNQGLASLYATANAPGDRNTMAQIAALQQQIANVNAQNGAGRQAANANANARTGMLQNGIKAVGGGVDLLGRLGGLFGNTGQGISNYYDGMGSTSQGITGYGGGLGDMYGQGGSFGMTPGSIYDNYNSQSVLGNSQGYGAVPAGDYFNTGGLGGVATNSGYEGSLDFNDPSSGFWD